MTYEEARDLTCDECPHYVDKGPEESYCRISHWREFARRPHQKKPSFCPIFKKAKFEAWESRKRNEGND